MPNEFAVSGKDRRLRRVHISREYLIETLKKSFDVLNFPMCYSESEWTIEAQYDPMDMEKNPRLQGIVVTRHSEKKGV